MPFVQREGARLYWRIDGHPERPALVLLNSLGCDHSLWEQLMPGLLRQFRVLRLDKPGHGAIIFYMTASFQKEEGGWNHQDAMPDVPAPEDSVPLIELINTRGQEGVDLWDREWASFDLHYVGDNRAADDPQRELVPVVQIGRAHV